MCSVIDISLASQQCIARPGFATYHIDPTSPASFLTLLFAAFACGCRTRCVKFGHRIRGPLFRWLRFASQYAMMVFRFLDRLLRKTASYRCERHHAMSSRCIGVPLSYILQGWVDILPLSYILYGFQSRVRPPH